MVLFKQPSVILKDDNEIHHVNKIDFGKRRIWIWEDIMGYVELVEYTFNDVKEVI
jgi:hypothetical protein